jgi:hypothetical protein
MNLRPAWAIQPDLCLRKKIIGLITGHIISKWSNPDFYKIAYETPYNTFINKTEKVFSSKLLS